MAIQYSLTFTYPGISLKAGSQCDARPCVALICEFLVKSFSDFVVIGCKDTMQRNARIGSESILALHCVATSVNAKAMQRNIWSSVIL